MQQISIRIENEELEKKLLAEAKKKGRKLAGVILDVLEKNFLKKESNIQYKTLDPEKHLSRINYPVDETDNLDDVTLFEDVDDSAAYIKSLRKNAWRR